MLPPSLFCLDSRSTLPTQHVINVAMHYQQQISSTVYDECVGDRDGACMHGSATLQVQLINVCEQISVFGPKQLFTDTLHLWFSVQQQ